MFEVSLGASGVNYSVERANELFEQHRQEIYRATDRLFARLMFFQWIAGILIAFLVAPLTWEGQSSQVHLHIWGAIFLGGAISIFPIWLTRISPGATINRYVIAVAQTLMSALLIALTGGRIETHFHVFGSLVILSFYRDWRVLIPATVVVALDHFLRGIYWPYSVYGVLTASPLRSLEHAGWVIFEDVFLVISCLRSIREMRSIATRTAALEASEQGFRQIFEDAPIGMAVVGLDESFNQVNTTLCQMVGYTESELMQCTTVDITFEDDIPQGKQNAEELLTGGPRSSVERRYIRKDGEVLWITRTACLMRDVDGHPRNFLIMVEDISERKQAEKALCESKRELEAAHHANQLIMDNSQDVICSVDEWGRFISVSAACEQLWGYTPAELVGRPYVELVCPEDRALTNQVAEVLRMDGKISDFVNRYTRKDGTLVDVLWSASWSEADKIMFCVAHDVTDRARIEKELREAKEEADRANHAKSEFLSRMSHELRTPLNAILGFGQLLERQNPTEAQRTRVNHIINAGRHLLNLINEVLDISRVETGNLQLSLEPVCVTEALEEALSLMRPLAAERGIELLTPAPLEPADYVMADRQRLQQVLLNLLTNAVKYTPVAGKVTVSSSTIGSGPIRIMVSDTGAGIPSEKLARLFTPFDRLGAEQSDVEGTGLGLALCQRLIHAMHGTIGVDSAVGSGSRFWVELARAESPFERVALEKHNGAYSQNGSEVCSRTILYVEDNLSNLTLIEQMLSDQSHIKLITAMQGKLGIELARRHSPDLILLDLHLPDLAGWEVLSRLQIQEATREIPVVIISADATSRQIKRLMAAGASAYLTKPLDMQEFFRVINETLAPRLAA
ncbi:MAG TPA: PAS domain S-box protein [Chthoniobacterales bacterium]|nr:PAS domain S-box protein [Chthoniobacterales bacterium]